MCVSVFVCRLPIRRHSTAPKINSVQLLNVSDLFLLQIEVIDSRKGDLERRIHGLTEERDALGVSLEEAQDRILMLEKTKREQEQQVTTSTPIAALRTETFTLNVSNGAQL